MLKIADTYSFNLNSTGDTHWGPMSNDASYGNSSLSLMEGHEKKAEKNSSYCCSFFSRIFNSIVNCLKFLFCCSSSKEKTKAKKPQVDKYGEVPLRRKTKEERERAKAEREARLAN
jgi:hypothetical protein